MFTFYIPKDIGLKSIIYSSYNGCIYLNIESNYLNNYLNNKIFDSLQLLAPTFGIISKSGYKRDKNFWEYGLKLGLRLANCESIYL